MSECSVSVLKEKLETNDIQLIDVREPVEFAAGRIATARLIPLGQIGMRHKEIDQTKTVYLICRSGNRSGRAKRQLESLGFSDVVNVQGGFKAWQDQGNKFERDESAPWDLERQVRFTAGLIILIGFLFGYLVSPYFLLISIFVGAGLVFSAITNTCGMGMILARMPWNQRKSATKCEPIDRVA